MRIVAVIVLAAAVVTPAAAYCATTDAAMRAGRDGAVEDVFRAFDLFGKWALDCDRPATPANPHVSIATPSAGLVLEHNDVGPDFAANRYSVLSAKRIAADRLEVRVLFMPGAQGEERQTLVLAVRHGTRRTMFNRVEGGPIRVRHGIVLASGARTPVLKKCR
jgi:hypothetical protein